MKQTNKSAERNVAGTILKILSFVIALAYFVLLIAGK